MKKMTIFLVFVASLFFLQGQVWAVSIIDLNDFHVTGNVSITTDGSSATMTEDPDYGSTLLSKDSYFLNCSGLYVPVDSMSLTFDYNFAEPSENIDEFYAVLYDLSFYDTPLTDSNENDLEFFTDASGSGTVTWNLLGTGFLGTTVGMEFQLNWAMYDSNPSSTLNKNSSVIISNVKINPIPEPATLFLIGAGLAGLFAVRKTKQKMQKN